MPFALRDRTYYFFSDLRIGIYPSIGLAERLKQMIQDLAFDVNSTPKPERFLLSKPPLKLM